MASPLRIACVGCGHGALNEIYERVEVQRAQKNWEAVDCVIIGGDFQVVPSTPTVDLSLRNANDATCISVPSKYKTIGDFHEYYSGQRVAPVLTIFCGGNHEAGNYLFELYYGGWVAPNIYYLGAANVLRLGSFRISGMSGIWKGYDYRKQHHERLPYNHEDIQSIYHIREMDVRKLLQVRTQVDIGLSHDWPRGIENHGNSARLFQKKKHLRDDSVHGRLGSQAARDVLNRLCPSYWFSAHLHTRFALTMGHEGVSLRKVPRSIDEPEEWCYEAATPANPTAPVEQVVKPSDEQIIPDPMLEQELEQVPKNEDEIDLDSSSESGSGSPPAKRPMAIIVDKSADEAKPIMEGIIPDEAKSGMEGIIPDEAKPVMETTIPDDIRSKLPASLARPEPAPQPPRKVIPEAIQNRVTKFLALDKPHGHDSYLELVEVKPISIQSGDEPQRPLRLQYDKEWLAITRVFAQDLQLGDPAAKVPPFAGEAEYLQAIAEAEEWVEENVVQKGLLEIPFNFTQVAPVFDPSIPITTTDAPPEYPNQQTEEFCTLIGITNKFALSDEESAARLAAGARPSSRPNFDPSHQRGGRGRYGRGRGGGRGRGRGGW
ncbi:Lariat debranching enzyme [Penicillium angulare]|uniref:Lariat debranching enzyme n=1 Tax=Penicillium angulare TaxID=116970 RepID=UPI00254110B7|nr:Lariat debranching enzyme [Penicillium angulare]KAJ5256890.1 Lariat debranching enzyme [Penicillium angulare]